MLFNYSNQKPFNVVCRSNKSEDCRYDFESCYTALRVFNSLVDSDFDGLYWSIILRYRSKNLKSYTNFQNC